MGEGICIYGHEPTRIKIRDVLIEYKSKGFTTIQPFAIGRIERRMAKYAENNRIELGSKSIYFTAKAIAHTNRQTKEKKGLAITANDFEDFPYARKSMDLFWDGDAFIYTDYKVKFIISPNYEIKIKLKTKNGKKHIKKKKVCLVTAGRVSDTSEFTLPKYRKV